MSATLTSVTTQAQGRLATTLGASLVTAGWTAAIQSARMEHDRSYPLEVVEKIEGAGAFDFALDGGSPALASWDDGFSQIIEIVYPYDATEQNPDPLDVDRYDVIRLDTGIYLRFRSDTPASGEYALISYTARHTLSDVDGETTLTDTDADALADLVAAHACEALAAHYIQITDSTVGADVVDRRTKSQECRSQAKVFRDAYAGKMASRASRGAGIAAPLRSNFATLVGRREDYFFHGRVYR